MKLFIRLLGAAVVSFTVSVSAQESAASPDSGAMQHPGGFLTTDYLGFIGTYTMADSSRNIGNADINAAYGVSALYGHLLQDHPHWGYEIHAFSEVYETEDRLRTDYYRYGFGGDATYAFGDRSKLTPFVLGGLGVSYNDVYPNTTEADAFDVFANVGAGFVTGPMTSVGFLRIRGEARYIYDNYGSGDGDIRLGLGVEIPLLKAATGVPVVSERVQIIEVPTGLTDSDGDGVVDEKDHCPGTPAGTRVDGEGCPLEKVIALNGVTFEFNKERLRPDAQTILDGASEILKRYPDMNVEVAGHTDNVGPDAYNQQLSERRADAVRTYFIEHGIPGEQMTIHGYGEAEPVADNETEEGRERNRRVELRILN